MTMFSGHDEATFGPAVRAMKGWGYCELEHARGTNGAETCAHSPPLGFAGALEEDSGEASGAAVAAGALWLARHRRGAQKVLRRVCRRRAWTKDMAEQ